MTILKKDNADPEAALKNFRDSLQRENPPEELPVLLRSLWYDAKGDWAKAHHLVDQLQEPLACRVHAYLHRKEGDTGNATYWYRNCGMELPAMTHPPAKEWEALVRLLC